MIENACWFLLPSQILRLLLVRVSLISMTLADPSCIERPVLQTCWSFICFPFNQWVGIQFELAEFSARDCSNIGKDPIANIHECQQAATELGSRYGLDGSWAGRAKGYYMLYSSYNRENIVFWNKHEKGDGRDFTRPICRKMNK